MCKIHRAELMTLPENLPNLEEVTLIANTDITNTDVVDFVRKTDKLMRLNLIVSQMDQLTNFENEILNEFEVKTFWDESLAEGNVVVQRKSFLENSYLLHTSNNSIEFPTKIEDQIKFWYKNDIKLE